MFKKKKKKQKDVEVDDDEKSAKKGLGILDSHHKIEIQFATTALSVTLLISGFVYSNIQHNNVLYQQEMTVSSTGQQVQFSKSSNTTLTLGNMQLSKDQKTAYIPLTFSSLSKVGIKASNYKIYVLDGANKSMSYKVSGRFFMYPSKNQAVLVLQSPTQIANEPLELLITNMAKVTTVESEGEDQSVTNNGGLDFGKYDVAAIKINPGASDIKNGTPLDADATSMSSVYSAVFETSQRQAITKKIAADKAGVAKDIKAAEALIERLQNAGYVVPSNPTWLSDSWRPSNQIDPDTGQTSKGKSGLSAYNSVQNMTNGSTNSPYTKFPGTLKNTKGQSMEDDNTNSTSSSSNSDSSVQTQDASAQWQQLQNIWTDVAQKKLDAYITQPYQMYQITASHPGIMQQASVGGASQVQQKSPVQVK